jgi:hypothetical protein
MYSYEFESKQLGQPDQISVFLASCNASLDKASSAAGGGGGVAQNQQLISEALAPALLLTIWLSSEPTHEAKLTTLVSLLNDTRRQVFTNDKFLHSLNETGFRNLCALFEKLILVNENQAIFQLRFVSNGTRSSHLHGII